MTETIRRNGNITIRDVANRALVSVGTASRVLNNHPNVEADLRMRVLAAANELGYALPKRRADYFDNLAQLTNRNPNPAIQEPARQITHLAFCCRADISPTRPSSFNPYFSIMLRGVEAECRQRNLHLIYRIMEDDANELEHGKRLLSESHADALLLINFIDRELIAGLLELGLPAVLVDHYFPDLALDVVSHENYNGSVRAVRHLIDRGHHRIGFVNGLPHYTVQRRFEGYRRALEEAGLPFDRSLIVKGNLSLEQGIEAAHEIMERKLDCTAYFCSNDQTAFGLIQGLRSYGLRVPEDISVIGFDDVEAAQLVSPALTTVKADPEGVGRMAVRKIIERVQVPSLPITQTLLYTTLVERDSVRSLI